MKTTITAALVIVLLASTATTALAQDEGRHRGGHRDEQPGATPNTGGERPEVRDSEPRDMLRNEERQGGGRRRMEVQAGQAPPAAPQPQAAPQPPIAVQAPQPGSRGRFRGDEGGQERANRDFGAHQRDGERRPDANRDDGRRDGRDNNRFDGRRDDNNRRWDRGDNNRFDGRRDGDRREGGGRGWDRHDDRGRPHWQQGRYPQVYRSQQRYRYGFYRPPIGFYAHSWGFGEYLPRGWYGSDYLVNDWWSYELPYPPPGYDWVRVGGDALLIDSYSGRVVQVVRNIFW